MKKRPSRRRRNTGPEGIRPEYDFTGAVRGATVARYQEGKNVFVIDPDVLDVFPDSASINDALRVLANVFRRGRGPRSRRRGATHRG